MIRTAIGKRYYGRTVVSHQQPNAALRDDLCSLFRKCAQPVTVITTTTNEKDNKYHGATLSSFTSISMDPSPLVAFALRTPSRMATLLKSHLNRGSSIPQMVINILSSNQSPLAVRFSRPDLFPIPFSSSPSPLSHDPIKYHLSKEGLPILIGSVGSLACELVQVISLDQKPSQTLLNGRVDGQEGPTSELFLARVLRIENSLASEDETLPLVYHRRQYVTVQSLLVK